MQDRGLMGSHVEALDGAVRGICREEMYRTQDKLEAVAMQCQQRIADAERALGQRISEFEGALVDMQKQFNLGKLENAVTRIQERMVDAERISGQRTSELEHAISDVQEQVDKIQGKVDKKASEQQLGTALNDVWEQLSKIQGEVSEKVYQHELESTVDRFQEEIVSLQGLLGKKMAQVELVMSGILPRIDGLQQQHNTSKKQVDCIQQRVSGLHHGIIGDKDLGQHEGRPEQCETMAALREQLADLRSTSAACSTSPALRQQQNSRLGLKAHFSGKNSRGRGPQIADDVESTDHLQSVSIRAPI